MKVFVYGTLRIGGRFSYLLENSHLIDGAKAPGYKLYDLGGDVPGMVKDDSGTVAGELYVVSEGTMEMLRRLEYGYEEKEIRVSTKECDFNNVTAFVWPDKNLPYVGFDPPKLVPSGDWMER